MWGASDRLRRLIALTHQHGLEVAARIAALLRRERALERLNAQRRAQLKGPVVMFDSIDLNQIPWNAQAVAGYVGGNWPTYSKLVVKYPKARHLSIAVNAGENAECLDVEAGDALPHEAPEWVKRQLARGVHRPVVYASLSVMPAIKSLLQSAGLLGSVRLWVAHYTNVEHLPAGFDACQWTDKALGRNLDQSICSPTFFQ